MQLASFNTADDFLDEALEYSRNTPIFIDSHLGKDPTGNEIRGEIVAKEIFSMGFKRIYLATGLAPANADKVPWLAGIRGKDAPFEECPSNWT